MSKALPWLDTATLHIIKAAFSHEDIGEASLALLEAIDTQLAVLATDTDETDNRMDVDDPTSAELLWRERTRTVLQGIPIPDHDRAGLENATSDDQFVRHVLACLPSVLNE